MNEELTVADAASILRASMSGDYEDPEAMFLSTVSAELDAVEHAFDGTNVTEDQKLIVAATRIPGLIHLVNIYK